jgi:hypothetical protein
VSSDDEHLTGWMTARDAELFQVLSRGLDQDVRARDAAAIARNERAAHRRLADADNSDGTT